LADARVLNLNTVTLKVDQSALTGESEPASKEENKI
jgi:magnesium-transporting ATPase (P-type)